MESPDQAEVRALVLELDAYQDSLYPAEARYALDISSLCQANVLFAVARDAAGAALGCCAIVLEGSSGELKRLFVQPSARGTGAADQLVSFLEDAASRSGCRTIYLETGPYQANALRFYARRGYQTCGPFGSYAAHPLSVFMIKSLARAH